MCNIMRCICVASIVMSKQSVLHILLSNRQSARAVWYRIWLVWLYFSHYLSCGKTLLIIKCVLIYCTILYEKFLILRRIQMLS
jgi:hypothetical protein